MDKYDGFKDGVRDEDIVGVDSEELDQQRAILAHSNVSDAVIKRLPRYFRYLRELLRQGRMRISSGELASLMNVTASQIRQDLNCFGGFGQQGYGYNVNYLFAKICEILGVGAGYRAVIINANELGRALVRTGLFEKRGVDIVGLFDTDSDWIGRDVEGVFVYDLCTLEEFCEKNCVDIAVLTLPQAELPGVARRLIDLGVSGIWNYTGAEIKMELGDTIVENIHLGDSLMILNYKIGSQKAIEDKENL